MEKDHLLVKIREAVAADAAAILNIHYDAVHQLGEDHYSPEQLNAWSPPVNQDRINHFLENADDVYRLVAEMNGAVVGFAEMVIEKTELRACYVSPQYTRQGIGQALVNALEGTARQHGLKNLQLDGSIIAEAFYKQCGYHITGRGQHQLNNGVFLGCVYMQKDL